MPVERRQDTGRTSKVVSAAVSRGCTRMASVIAQLAEVPLN